MVSGVPSLVAAALGTVAGVFLGNYWLDGSSLSLLLAGAALATTAVVPLALARATEHARAREDLARVRAHNRSRYDAHAEALNERAFRPLRDVCVETARPDPAARRSEISGLGIPEGPGVRPLDSLPHWRSASQHLATEPTLSEAWTRATETAASYRQLQLRLVRELQSQFEHRVLGEYGFDVRLGGSPGESTTWCDVGALAWLAAARPDGIDPRELTVVTPLEETETLSRPGPPQHIIAVSGSRLLVTRVPEEADPRRLHAVFSAVVRSGSYAVRSRALRAAEETAIVECQRFAQGVRDFSDRILLEHTFSGTCDGCRPWTPR